MLHFCVLDLSTCLKIYARDVVSIEHTHARLARGRTEVNEKGAIADLLQVLHNLGHRLQIQKRPLASNLNGYTEPPPRTYAFVDAVEEVEVLAVALAHTLGGNALQAGTVLVRVLLALGLAGLANRGHHVNGFFSGLVTDSAFESSPSLQETHRATPHSFALRTILLSGVLT